MAIRIVRLGTPRAKGEGPRLGAVRRPPRGVPRSEFAKGDWYDAWLPMLAPAPELVTQALHAQKDHDERAWARFEKRFRAEMKAPDASRLLDTLAVLSQGAAFSLGCYCPEERWCHRGVLRALLQERGAAVKD
jgi:uncharacterized protein YeaO (DUF488 family)